MLGLALVTTVSLNSCSSEEEDAAGDGTEQNDADVDQDEDDADMDQDKDDADMDQDNGGDDMEPEMNTTDDDAAPGKAVGKGVNNMSVDPEPKPTKEAVRGGGKPKMTTDGSN